jgi:hypothetical protein
MKKKPGLRLRDLSEMKKNAEKEVNRLCLCGSAGRLKDRNHVRQVNDGRWTGVFIPHVLVDFSVKLCGYRLNNALIFGSKALRAQLLNTCFAHPW